jgi:hypothetical protein
MAAITTRFEAKLLSASMGSLLRVLGAKGRAQGAPCSKGRHHIDDHDNDQDLLLGHRWLIS